MSEVLMSECGGLPRRVQTRFGVRAMSEVLIRTVGREPEVSAVDCPDEDTRAS